MQILKNPNCAKNAKHVACILYPPLPMRLTERLGLHGNQQEGSPENQARSGHPTSTHKVGRSCGGVGGSGPEVRWGGGAYWRREVCRGYGFAV